MLGEHTGRIRRTTAQSNGDGLTHTTRQRQQLQRGLADGTVHVVDKDENFSHGTSISCVCEVDGERGTAGTQMNFWPARNSASALPPSPSSFTIVPAVRAGRCAAESTAVHAPARPTSSASIPRSSRSSD